MTSLVNRNLDLMIANNDSNAIHSSIWDSVRSSLVGETCDATGSWYVLDNKRDTNNRVYRSVNLNSSTRRIVLQVLPTTLISFQMDSKARILSKVVLMVVTHMSTAV